MAEYEDTDYDVYALFDAVPRVVRELEQPGSRCGAVFALFAAFFGIDSVHFGNDSELLP
jgi:hypothetical protein